MTSEERREVAARLRALPLDTYASIRKWEKDGLFIGASLSDEADYIQIHNAVLGCFPAEYIHPGDHEELHERLADLIDPTCHVVTTGEWHGRPIGSACSVCHAPLYSGMRYCPHCWGRVVSDNGLD